MSAFNTVLFVLAAVGFYICWFSAKAIYLHQQGIPILHRNGMATPFFIWPFFFFFGLMIISGSLPGLLGHPMWLVDMVFSLIFHSIGS
ncbi:hypothetical protein HQN60_12755 [Deefgea piscis]|uniref:NADH dehydrogenase subunit 4 n=1 Tax=Deefgea piscis TaxID=2739061 RepID=A0A6M8SVA0_9NEIS|nr:hypothetical protein [Deefgea piscis]QKJ67506.1 hypothetical protein HQN60_12755 [Deefgea piscis]